MADTRVPLETHLAVLSKMLEYEHALEHVAEFHDGQCDDCRRLAQGAIDGKSHADFMDSARFRLGLDD